MLQLVLLLRLQLTLVVVLMLQLELAQQILPRLELRGQNAVGHFVQLHFYLRALGYVSSFLIKARKSN